MIENKGFMNILGIAQQMQPVDNGSVSNKSNGGAVKFKDVLERSVVNTAGNNLRTKPTDNDLRNINSGEKQAASNVNPKITCFKDINPNAKPIKDSEKMESEMTMTNSLDELDESLNEEYDILSNSIPESQDINDFLSVISFALGLQPSELKKLFDYLGIDAAELSKATDVNIAAEKIAGVIGLNADQKTALIKLFEITARQVDTIMRSDNIPVDEEASNPTTEFKDKLLIEKAIGESNQPKEKNLQTAQIVKIEIPNEVKTQMLAIKAKIQILFNNVQEAESVKADILQNTQMPQKMVEETGLSANTVKTDNQISTDNKSMIKSDNISVSEKSVFESSLKNSDSDKDILLAEKADPVQADVVPGPVTAETGVELVDNKDMNINPGSLNAGLNSKIAADETVLSIQKESPVSRNEIINQVIEKAKITLTGEKSEMVVDLKPDSLGKIAMKIVTEHGIVSAKFVTENQQVKQILESNMQFLKDTLEKQGLTVQGFTVSVGHGKSGGSNSDGNTQQSEGRNNRMLNPIQTASAYVSDISGRSAGIYGRLATDSHIDLIA